MLHTANERSGCHVWDDIKVYCTYYTASVKADPDFVAGCTLRPLDVQRSREIHTSIGEGSIFSEPELRQWWERRTETRSHLKLTH